jgi:hypothetical protein
VNDEARRYNQNLPGMGGVFNTVNLHTYHYAGNNPVRYTDPDGRDTEIIERNRAQVNARISDFMMLTTRNTYTDMGLPAYGPCYMRSLIAVAETFIGRNLSLGELNQLVKTLTTGPSPIVDNVSVFDVNGKTYPQYSVKNSVAVITEALKLLDSEHTYTVRIATPDSADYGQVKANAVGSLISVPGHWQEGDERGRFRWDPYHRSNNKYWNRTNENATRYVSITKVQDTRQNTLD